MWTKPEQLTSVAVARPLRVAYVIDLDDAPEALFEAIISEAYGRWGGRRTLIVPGKPDGIDTRYRDWLFYFDADVIYSFARLDNAAVADVHERYGPGRLLLHRDWRRDAKEERSFRIELPLRGLSSLSVLPVFASRSWGFDGPPRNIKLLTKFWDGSESSFLQENFGFVSASFVGGAVTTAYPDLFSGMTLITQEALDNRQWRKDERASHVTSEDAVLDALGGNCGPLTLAQLSEWFSPYLETGEGLGPDGTCIVAGDTAEDRLLSWNVHHRFARLSLSEITALRLPASRQSDDAFLGRIRSLLERRGARGHNNRNEHVTLMSCSLSQAELETLAERMRKPERWLAVTVQRQDDPSVLAPRFRDPMRVHYTLGGYMAEPQGRATAEFQGSRAPVPVAMPWHMREALPPAGLRGGNWMVDITLDRLNDHSRFADQRDIWMLPRRLRLERAFALERESDQDYQSDDRFLRVMRSGAFGLALDTTTTRAAITVPDDLDAMRMGICNNAEWVLFDTERKDAPRGRLRFAYAEPSDKGRYLLGVLGLFGSVPDAFRTLMHGFWRDALQDFGGVPAETDAALVRQTTTVLRRRLRQRTGPVTLKTDEDVERLARATLHCGTLVARAPRYKNYKRLLRRWEAMVETFLRAHPKANGENDDSTYRDVRRLDRSIKYLCQQEVLFQGREWRCAACYNRNWVALGDLAKTLSCSICGRKEPAPVSGDWQFKANPFLVDAYRDHGTEAVIWALWCLWDRSRHSFYFAPSLKLWVNYPKQGTRRWDAEVDAIAVVDGAVYLVEAKCAAGLDEGERAQLVMAAERIRPDVLIIASMEKSNGGLERAVKAVRAALPAEIEIEVLSFDPDQLERTPFGLV